MFPIGFFLVVAGIWLADSAYHGRPPLSTLTAILRNPQHMNAILSDTQHTNTAASPSAPSSGGNPFIGTYMTGDAGAVVAYAEAQIGKPYRWGHAGPNAYDCSGLIYAAYASIGIKIPRVTAGQIIGGRHVSRKNLQPGDLVFPEPGHVMLYAGGGQCVEAPHTGTTIHMTPIYRFFTARRYLANG